MNLNDLLTGVLVPAGIVGAVYLGGSLLFVLVQWLRSRHDE